MVANPAPLAPEFEAHAFSVRAADGLHLAAERHGSGAPGALLAHGFGQTRQSWSATARRLHRAGLAVTSFDARGHGESGYNDARSAYTVEQLTADMQAVSATVAGPRLLVGASMGGLVGLLLQARKPVFAAMVLVDITPRWENDGFRRILDFMSAHPEGFDDAAHAAEAIAAYLPHRRQRKRPDQLAALLKRRDDGRLLWHWDPRLLHDLPAQSEPIQRQLVEAATRIDVPLLLITGGRSDLVSTRTIDEFLAHVPHAVHVRIDEATHMVAGDDNDAFSACVEDFLNTPAARAALLSGEQP